MADRKPYLPELMWVVEEALHKSINQIADEIIEKKVDEFGSELMKKRSSFIVDVIAFVQNDYFHDQKDLVIKIPFSNLNR